MYVLLCLHHMVSFAGNNQSKSVKLSALSADTLTSHFIRGSKAFRGVSMKAGSI